MKELGEQATEALMDDLGYPPGRCDREIEIDRATIDAAHIVKTEIGEVAA